MVRPIFGKIRTVVIPATLPSETFTLDEYKEKTGIDLLDVFNIILDENGYIQIYAKENTLVLIQSALLDEDDAPIENGLSLANDRPQQDKWISGSSDGMTIVGYSISNGLGGFLTGGGLEFTISKNSQFKVENIKVLFIYN